MTFIRQSQATDAVPDPRPRTLQVEPDLARVSCAHPGCGGDVRCPDCHACGKHCDCAGQLRRAARLGLGAFMAGELVARDRFRLKLARLKSAKK